MSTIERAMRRMGHVEEPPAELDDLLDEAAAGEAGAEEEARPRPAPGEAVTGAQPGDGPPAAAADGPQAATAAEGLAAGADRETPVAAAPANPDETAVQGPPTVMLDVRHLAAAGYLVPGESSDAEAEEYQRLKRRVLGNIVTGTTRAPGAPANLVMVTSSIPGEGKTFTTANLAMSIANEMDRTVLAVDTDAYKCDLSRLFGVDEMPGLYDVLSGTVADLSEVLVRTSVPKLVLLPAGLARGSSAEKLASERMAALMRELATRYTDRVVLFDCPPALATATAVALADHCGQVLLVVEAGRTTRELVRASLEALEHVGVTGVVLNKARHQPRGYRYYGYGYGYGYRKAPAG